MLSIQFISLTALCLHYSSLTILMHLSRAGQQQSSYRASSAVMMTELLKLLLSLIFAIKDSVSQITPIELKPLPSPRSSRFEPQFESLPEEEEDEQEGGEEEEDYRHQIEQTYQSENRVESTSISLGRREEPSKWNEESDRLMTDVIGQIQSNSSKIRQRTVSSEAYLSQYQTGQRGRSTSGSGIQANHQLDPKPNSNEHQQSHQILSRSNFEHSHRLSVLSSPQLVLPDHPRSSHPHWNDSLFSLSTVLESLEHLRASVFSQDWWLISIPSVMFVIQNNLQYLAASNLSVPVFQITYQLKILTTALCSVLLLHRRLKKRQWISLVLLTLGVAIVQLNTQETSSSPSKQTTQDSVHRVKNVDKPQSRNQLIGLIAVVSACLSSGFASVYLERMFKSTGPKPNLNSLDQHHRKSSGYDLFKSNRLPRAPLLPPSASIWIRNIQLSSFGLLVSIVIVVMENQIQNPLGYLTRLASLFLRAQIDRKDEEGAKWGSRELSSRQGVLERVWECKEEFFKGFSNLTWLVIVFQVTGGILNSVVMKYSNNINKNFSICLSIILSIVLSHVLMPADLEHPKNDLNVQFFLGSFLVVFSTWLYNL